MATPLLSDLREPPVVGRYYMVPMVTFPWFGRVDHWPVLGPLHSDVEHFNFPTPHYHIDARFLTAHQAAFAARRDYASSPAYAAERAVQRSPLACRSAPVPTGRPRLSRRKCRTDSVLYMFGSQDAVQALRADYADPALPIRRADGRLLCPHRKVDLSSFPPDENGIVTCPLHGLRVRCRQP